MKTVTEKEVGIMRDKLISFPKFVLDKLEEYRKLTGISASDYIRKSVIKQMIGDELIFFKTTYIKLDNKKQQK